MKTSALDLQPMSLGDILDRAVRLYRRHFLHTLAIVSLPHLLIIPAWSVLGSGFAGRGRPLAWQNPTFMVGGSVFVLAYIYFYFASMGALARSVSERYLGGSPTIWTSYFPIIRLSLSLVWAYILASLAGICVLGVGSVLFGLGLLVFNQFRMIAGYVVAAILGIGSIVMIYYAVRIFLRSFLITQIIVIENIRGWTAIKRSWKLMRPSVGKAGLILVFGSVVSFVISFLFNFPAGMVVTFRPGWPTFALSRVLSGAGQVLSAPFAMIAFTLLYYDCRIRQEAFDLEMMARNLGVSTSPSSPSEMPTPTHPTPPPPAAPAIADAQSTGPSRPFGAFKVCPQCGAQVPNIQPNCGKCGARVPFRPAIR
jgi:hypothetical protein